MTKLPEMKEGMRIDHALYLELLHILIDEGILTEEKATVRYEKRLNQIKTWQMNAV